MMEKVNGVFDFSTVSFVNDNWAALVIIVELLLLTINAVVYRRNLVLSIQSSMIEIINQLFFQKN